jgi:ADP-glucose pyrophosphorylase
VEDGARVERSAVLLNARVREGAVVRETIVLEGETIGRGARRHRRPALTVALPWDASMR